MSTFKFWLKYKSGLEKFETEPPDIYPNIQKAWRNDDPSYLPKLYLAEWQKYCTQRKDNKNVDF